jgi:hypothetical protein
MSWYLMWPFRRLWCALGGHEWHRLDDDGERIRFCPICDAVEKWQPYRPVGWRRV